MVPCPRVVAISIRPPRLLTSVLTTSMPTPRPAIWVTSPAVENPGWKIRVVEVGIVDGFAGGNEAKASPLRSDALGIEAAPVVAHRNDDFAALLAECEGDFTDLDLPQAARSARDSMPW